MSWIIDHLPWWGWVLIAAVPAVIAWPYFMALPPKAKAAVVAIVSGIGLYFSGRKRGAKDVEDKQKVRNAQATENRMTVERKNAQLTPADRSKRLSKWDRD